MRITVHGKPRSRGSKRPVRLRNGKTLLLDSDRHSRDWVDAIRAVAGEAWCGELLRGPVKVHASFHFQRPKNHYRTGKHADSLKPAAPLRHSQKPDVDKSLRGVLDGLTGVVFADDSQVSIATAEKWWTSEGARTEIEIFEL